MSIGVTEKNQSTETSQNNATHTRAVMEFM